MDSELNYRLEQLERRNRWLTGALLVTACLAFVGVFRAPVRELVPAADPAAISEIIRTRRLEVVNKQGDVVILGIPAGDVGSMLTAKGPIGTIGLMAGPGKVFLQASVSGTTAGKELHQPNVLIGSGREDSFLEIRHGDEAQTILLPGQPDT